MDLDPLHFLPVFHLNFMRDTRDNPINAYKGNYINFCLAPRFQFLGSNANWTSMLLEWRGYFRFPRSSNNILAFWSYNWVTLWVAFLLT